jgi:hypothetical protein
VSLDSVLWFSGSVAEAAVIGLLLYRRAWRTLPIFLMYSVWTLVGSAASYAILRNYNPASSVYVTAYLAAMIVDALLLFGVLVELAWSVLRPIRTSLPRSAPVAIAILILILGAIIWPFSAFSGAEHLSREVAVLMHLQQTFSILRVLAFLVLAGGSQLLSIGWRDRELQIATGLGFTSLVSLAITMMHAYQSTWTQYFHLTRAVVASYLCSLVYWMFSFAQKEESRRSFSPQMQNALLAVAGAARTVRVAWVGTRVSKGRQQDKNDL